MGVCVCFPIIEPPERSIGHPPPCQAQKEASGHTPPVYRQGSGKASNPLTTWVTKDIIDYLHCFSLDLTAGENSFINWSLKEYNRERVIIRINWFVNVGCIDDTTRLLNGWMTECISEIKDQGNEYSGLDLAISSIDRQTSCVWSIVTWQEKCTKNCLMFIYYIHLKSAKTV